ncbi:DUF1565 domain-containing protein [Fodinibius sp. AD559]|uniref:DUF1565 domain-containing protein n=1 Tax=Fodinibius sp. AD559 TaxID=3424179 RepID=UPI004046C96A
MINKATLFSIVISIMLFFGCSDNSTGPDNTNDGDNPPAASATADAGSDSDEIVGFEITADGSGSSGSSNVSYSWTISSQPANSSTSLTDAETETPTFIPDLPGEYTLQLEVTSDGESDTDEVTFSAIAKRLFVNANNGTDGDIDGYIQDSPLKTITKALSVYDQNEDDAFLDIDTIRVAEGLYDQANGESFPLSYSGNLIVKGDQEVDRNNIHILSPDVDRDPAIYVGEGVTLRHLKIENGYTGGTFNGDPDAVFVTSGTDLETSRVILEDLTLTTNNENGYIISTGSNIRVDFRDFEGARNTIDGKNIGYAYSNRFNTSNVNLNVSSTDVINIGDGGAFHVDDVNNLSLTVANSTIRPSVGKVNDYAFDLEDEVDLLLENTTISSSDGSETGGRFKYGIVMDNAQPNTNIEVLNSTIQYTQWSAILMRDAVVKVTDSFIEGVLTHKTDVNLAYDAIRQLDGTLVVRGTTFKDINTSAIDIGGPNLPNDNNFYVDLGTDQDPGNNTFQNVMGWDIQVSRSGEVETEIPALGNSWSNGGTPRCRQNVSDYDLGEIYVNDQGGSLRYSASGVCN